MATTVNKTKTTPKTLTEFIDSRVTVLGQNHLPERLGITSNKLTRIRKSPAIADITEVRSIALLFNVDPIYLVDRFGLGLDGLTARQLRQLELKRS